VARRKRNKTLDKHSNILVLRVTRMPLFGKKKSPEEVLKQNQRALNRTIRLVQVDNTHSVSYQLASYGVYTMYQ